MDAFFRRIVALDRRWIFLVLLVTLFAPIACPLNLSGLKASPGVSAMYNHVEGMKEGQTILVSFDFDPASAPELEPMAIGIMRHAFRKKLKVVAMGLWVTGLTLEKKIVEEAAAEAKAVYGVDYVNLGWKPGSVAVITGMGEDIYSTFPTDTKGSAVGTIPLMKDLRRLKDFDLVVSIAAGTPGIDTWIAYGADKYKFKIGGGTTAVQSPAMAVYLQAGQLVGLIPAMRGAAEYEFLLDRPGTGTKGVDAISLGHYLIVALILLGNLAWFVTRRNAAGVKA
ncbi:MAG: hypothetical protein HUU15_07195 [Candidatus Brocadiae bacterium]|nr:hypothetical protein [Candidatus Brocadiia bacterium]